MMYFSVNDTLFNVNGVQPLYVLPSPPTNTHANTHLYGRHSCFTAPLTVLKADVPSTKHRKCSSEAASFHSVALFMRS